MTPTCSRCTRTTRRAGREPDGLGAHPPRARRGQDHRLVGLVTQRGVLRLLAQGAIGQDTSVADVMRKSADLITVTPETTTLERSASCAAQDRLPAGGPGRPPRRHRDRGELHGHRLRTARTKTPREARRMSRMRERMLAEGPLERVIGAVRGAEPGPLAHRRRRDSRQRAGRRDCGAARRRSARTRPPAVARRFLAYSPAISVRCAPACAACGAI